MTTHVKRLIATQPSRVGGAAFRRLFSSLDSPFERRHRWWEKPLISEKEYSYTSSVKWWQQTELPEVVAERARREAIRREVSPISESTVRRPPPRRIGSDPSAEKVGTMREIIAPFLENAQSESERTYLESFSEKPCRIGHNFFDMEKWAALWTKLADDYKVQNAKWERDYAGRKAEKRKQRIREWEGVQSTIAQVFNPKRAAELFGPDWKAIDIDLNGLVVKKQGNQYHVLWAVPGLKNELVVHDSDEALDTIYPAAYVPDFDAFVFKPSFDVSPEDWVEQIICEHPLVLITESKNDPRFLSARALLKDAPYAIVDLSIDRVSAERRAKIRDHVVKLTNWPWLPQIFISAVFMGGVETLEQINRSGSLDTVLVVSGVRQKGLVEREMDKYKQLVTEQIGEWRYKQMDKLMKSLEQDSEPSGRALSKGIDSIAPARGEPDSVVLKWPDRAQREAMLARLKKNDRVDELFYDDLRRKFMRESAMEIERLVQLREANKTKYLLPEDDERLDLEVLQRALEHPYFVREAQLKNEVARLRLGISRPAAVSDNPDMVQHEEGVETFNLTSGPTSSIVPGEESPLPEMTEDDVREVLEDDFDPDIARRKASLAAIRTVNAHIQKRLGVQQRRIFSEFVTKSLGKSLKTRRNTNLAVEDFDDEGPASLSDDDKDTHR